MAEAWARALLPGALAFSAGTAPGAAVDRRAVLVMAEAGIDISAARPKHVDAFKGETFDLVVTVCANADRNCPAYWGPGKRMHRGFDDPGMAAGPGASDEEALPVYRRVRDEIKAFVLQLPSIAGTI